ncbi:hypothetical protein Dsin_027402 [Dipteronia sinensis]|uniref:Uncharacterized protein n=1 Tax=Dipteronia sinensis TaxID=43782 RepID=A0AAE0DTJ1_9ROSI|nr:hypothetical protein Dsin_027402 [Dipteronia sinensis]
MDIDPLRITGWWFLGFDYNFMAPATRSSSVLYHDHEPSKRHQALLIFLVLVLLIVPLFARPIYSPSRQLLSYSELHPQPTQQNSPSSSTTVSTTSTSRNATDREFRAAAHEVPSGPNPEQNK